jgi:hypothetical protein
VNDLRRRDQPPEQLSRVLRCPKCRQSFETMRRWRLACPECGHEWEEASQLGAGDRITRFRDDAFEHLFLWACWAGVTAIVLFVGAIFVIGFLRVAERGGVGVALPLIAFLVVVILIVAALCRPFYEHQERMMFWRMGWRGGKNDPKDYDGR